MARQEFYIGSTGPFYYDDTAGLPGKPAILQKAFRGMDVVVNDPGDGSGDSVSEHIADASIHFTEADFLRKSFVQTSLRL